MEGFQRTSPSALLENVDSSQRLCASFPGSGMVTSYIMRNESILVIVTLLHVQADLH